MFSNNKVQIVKMRITPILVLIIGLACLSHAGKTKTGDATYYNLGVTACGKTYKDSDLVAAVAFSYFKSANPNKDPMCRKRAIVTDPKTKKSVTVRIKDKCQACSNTHIDLSLTAFRRLRKLGVGRFTVRWRIID